MRNQRAGIRLWADDGGRVLRQLSTEEANRGLAWNHFAWLHKNGKCIGVRMVTTPKQSATYAANRESSFGPLTTSDAVNNALGCAEIHFHTDNQRGAARRVYGLNSHETRDESIIGNSIDRAMSKVEAWPFIGDDRAVRVGIRV